MQERISTKAWPRNTRGELLCAACDGEKVVEVQLAARSSAQESPDYALRDCERCHGDGLEPCPCCHDAAVVIGTDGKGYCSIAAAFDEEAWGACIVCETAPQRADAPTCGDACHAFITGENFAAAEEASHAS